MAFLQRINHEHQTKIEIDRKELSFGRDQKNDVCIEKYEDISRFHCGFTRYEDGVVTVTDFGSRNGTYVNGKQIFEETKLKHGDLIKISRNLEFRFVDYDSPEGQAELEAERKAKEEEERRKQREIKADDPELSQAMNELQEEIERGKGFKTLMAEIVKQTRPEPKKKFVPPPDKSINQYGDLKIRRR
ncbi:MAG: FHA domain-containing protein [Lentisphaerae bacterium]|nr:MAG: FHA domain-containing protein [Lentisphaerota bacterium]